MGKHLVLVGGGHAHMTVLAKLSDFTSRGHRVTLVSPGPYHYYSGMAPGMLSGFYDPRQLRFNIRKMTEDRGGVFVEDRVVGVDAGGRSLQLASGAFLDYDVVSFNTGSTVPCDVFSPGDPRVVPVKPVENLLPLRRSLMAWPDKKSLNLLVVGGGPAGIEMAGGLCSLLENSARAGTVILACGEGFLPDVHSRVRTLTRRSLDRRGVIILERARVEELKDGTALLADDRRLAYDYALVAVGARPQALFKASGLTVGGRAGLTVNGFLQSVGHPEIFGGGDCIDFVEHPLAKVGVFALKQSPVLYHNLMAALESGALQRFMPQKRFMLIFNMGDGTGVLHRGLWSMNSRRAFLLKDRIDRHFMRSFQLSGELEEDDPCA